MNREDRRLEQKTRGRRLKWLEKEAKRNEKIAKIIAELEENFEGSEIENAKAFLVDCVTFSGPFSDEHAEETIDKTAKFYGLETADGLFILDTVEEMLDLKGEEEKESENKNSP